MKKYGVKGFPTILLIGANGEELDRTVGFREVPEFLDVLNGFKTGETHLTNYVKKLGKNPENLELNFELGKKYAERNDSQNAKIYLAKVSQKAEIKSDLKKESDFLIAKMDLEEGKTGTMQKFLEAFGATEQGLEGFFDLGRYFEKKKEVDFAYKTYSQLIENHPENANALNAFAWFSAENNRELEKALEIAINAVKLSNESPQIIDTLAEIYFRMGFKQDAIKTIMLAIEKEPNDNYYKEQLKKFEDKK
ncbi:hypothetical protein IT568_05835 [bacterium]|nr:hypothetical protein [bacterium]